MVAGQEAMGKGNTMGNPAMGGMSPRPRGPGAIPAAPAPGGKGKGKRLSSAANAPGGPRPKQPRMMGQQGGMGMRKIGMVLSFNGNKGFGFISGDAGTGDVFFSRDGLAPGTPHELSGRTVSYELKFNPANGKPQASNVSLS